MGVFDALRAASAGALLAVAMLTGGVNGVFAADGEPEGAETAETALRNFDRAMLSILRRSQADLTARTRPVMLIARDVTVVTKDGENTYPRDGRGYNELKTVSHVLLGIIGAVTPWPRDDAGKARMKTEFAVIQTEIGRFLTTIDDLDLPAETIARQRDMLGIAETFVNRALSGKELLRADVSAAINKMRPVWAANMRDAARTELEALHRAVTAARDDLSADEWDRIYVVSHGGPDVRAVNVVRLYLQRVMPGKMDAGQVLFAVDTHGKDKMIDYAGYVRMQRIVGAWAFGDPKRMEVDLLGYEAGAILDEIIPASAPERAYLE
ncbi:MAG: hypothetical protein AAGF82_10000 [Pseudomonadota bacterium]